MNKASYKSNDSKVVAIKVINPQNQKSKELVLGEIEGKIKIDNFESRNNYFFYLKK